MYCKNCGKQIDENKKFCENCGVQIIAQGNTPNSTPNINKNTIKSNNKVYKILSYIGILWLIGLFSSSAKEDPKVRFHIGQGIIATISIAILYVCIAVINNLVIANIFRDSLWGISYVNGTGIALMNFLYTIASAIGIAIEIIGIVHASKDEEKELPVIGTYAFYK